MFAVTQSPIPSPPRQRARRAWMRLAALALLSLSTLPLHGNASRMYQIKAAFLYNFTKFVEWPAHRFADDTSPIVIGVLGKNPFGSELETIVRDRKVNGRGITIVQLPRWNEALRVHVVFIAGTDGGLGGKEVESLIHAGVLVVGDSEQLLPLGSTLTFTSAADKVRFTINMAAADRGGLKISAQLQKLATVTRR